jgi:hypothetical protein
VEARAIEKVVVALSLKSGMTLVDLADRLHVSRVTNPDGLFRAVGQIA